ncbi:MAG: cation-translocating P-type ATPase [Chlamydiia bacterium]|nr:cation-translocating P-type ATPase [Chlamydiia bacterium]
MSKLLLLIAAALAVLVFEGLALGGIFFNPLIYLAFIIGIGYETLYKGFKALIQLNFKSIRLLMVIAVLGAIALGQYEEAAVVIVLFTLAEELEGYGFQQSRKALSTLVDKMPRTARVEGKDSPVPIDMLKVGDILLIKAHEAIPADAEVLDGTSYVDESSITGEPLPKEKEAGALLFAGTLNLQGALRARVLKKTEDSTLAQIQRLTFEALERKSKTVRFIDAFAGIYTPIIMALALFLAIVPWAFFGADFRSWFLEALTLLVISCPCALVISAPMSVYSAVGKASKLGALIKGGLYLEALGKAQRAAFDKTRTLTYGKPEVTDIEAFNGYSTEDVLACAAGIELFSSHPLSESIVAAAKNRGITPHEAKHYESVTGKGAKAECQICSSGHRCLGNMPFVQEEHPLHDAFQERVTKLQQEGKTVVVLGAQEGAVGLIALSDTLRPDAKPTIDALKSMGIAPLLLTGDQPASAQAVADAVGIEEVKSALLPEEKLKALGENTLMCGDGINDAPALAAASCGIAFSALGSEAALESASVVILNDRLSLIPELILLGRRTLGIIRFNTVLAIGVKVLFIALALAGRSSLAGAIFADVGITIIVVLNSLRLMR